MSDTPVKDAKLVQYLNEAYSKEKELEVSLEAHIGMTTLADRKAYKKRLKDHLRETKSHSKALERRVKKLGGSPGVLDSPREALASGVGKVAAVAKGQVAAAKGPLHAVRGTSEQEVLLKNAKTEYFNEHEEIATYTAIETLAEAVGDKETAKLARDIRRDEEKMARYLEKLIPSLTKAVVKEEIPAAERRKPSARRRTSSATKSKSAASKRSGGAAKKSTGTARKRSAGAAKRPAAQRKRR
jgi:ferritin-like metal-binding protein YciE